MDTDRQSSTCRGASCSFSLVDHDTVDDALEHMRFHERTLKQHARECSAQRKPYLVNQSSPSRSASGANYRARSPSSRGWSVLTSGEHEHHVTRACADEIESLTARLTEADQILRREQHDHAKTLRELRRLRHASRHFCSAEMSRASLFQKWAENFTSMHGLTEAEQRDLDEVLKNDAAGNAFFNYPLWNEPGCAGNNLYTEEELALLNDVLLRRDVLATRESDSDSLEAVHEQARTRSESGPAALVRAEDI